MNSDPRMRRFQSHKVVQAGLLRDIEFLSNDEADIEYDFRDNGHGGGSCYGRRVKSPGLRHRLPVLQYQPDTFYVVLYQDGYVSFCPRETFEAGHTEIGESHMNELEPKRIIEEGSHRFTKVVVLDEPGAGGACHEYRVDPVVDNGVRGFASVSFQNGPVNESGVNGCHHEDLLLIVVDRLRSFQAGQYACSDNAEALCLILGAIDVLNRRTKARQDRGVEGTSSV